MSQRKRTTMAQTDAILRHLRNHGSITPIEALNLYGSFRLAARVGELRQDGHEIRTVMVERGGRRWAMYRLMREPVQAGMW